MEEKFLLVDRSGTHLDPSGEQVAAAAADRFDARFEHALSSSRPSWGSEL